MKRGPQRGMGSAFKALAPALAVPICGGTLALEAQEPGEVFRDCEICPQMVVVPAGSFMMGGPETDAAAHADEMPQHRVTIDYSFAVGVYEVTFDEWDECVRSGGCDEHEPDGDGWGGGRLPSVNVRAVPARPAAPNQSHPAMDAPPVRM